MVRFRFCSCFFFLSFSTSLHVGSYSLPDEGSNLLGNDVWETNERHELGFDRKFDDVSTSESENQIEKADASPDGNSERRKWLSVLTYDRAKNLTEKDKGPGNDSKIIFINSEDHLRIYENDEDDDEDDDEDETGIQDREGLSFNLVSPEGFLSRIDTSDDNGLERTKREAESGKRKCRCRRKGRRVVRRRRRRRRGRRRRVGQARPARRRRRGRRRGAGRRRGRRRCVCRKKGGGEGEGGGEEEEEGEEEEGKGDEEPEVEEADGDDEMTTTEGGEEPDEKEEEQEEDEEDENSEDEEYSDEESDEEGPEMKPPHKNEEMPSVSGNHEVPVYVIPYPGTSGTYVAAPNTAGAPVYTNVPVPFSPYPYYTGSPLTVPVKP